MAQRRTLTGILAGLGLLVLIFDSGTALAGARTGVGLCLQTVIPALFPFFVLSMLLTSTLQISAGGFPGRLAALLGIPAQGVGVLIPAFLGGYPVGAKCVADLYRHGQLSKPAAERMLAFCSNAGPSFLFGMVSGFFPEKGTLWLLWGIQLLSAVFTALSFPGVMESRLSPSGDAAAATGDILPSAAKAMALVCCWVVLFRMLILFLRKWFLWRFPIWFQVLAAGFLELTNGCCMLDQIPDVRLRFLLCACMLSLGGLCVLMQTVSVTKGLSIRGYLLGKLTQTLYSLLIGCAITGKNGLWLFLIVAVLPVFFRKIKIHYGNPGKLPV